MAHVDHDKREIYFDNIEQLQACIQQVGPIPNDYQVYVAGEKIR